MRITQILALMTVVLLAPGLALANHTTTQKRKLIVVDRASGKDKVAFSWRNKSLGSSAITKGDGTDVNQISARLDVAYLNGSAAGAFTLPAGASNGTDGWLVNSDKIAKYLNKAAPGGPTQVTKATVKPNKAGRSQVKLIARGLGDEGPLDILSAGDPLSGGGVMTEFCVTNGGEEFCYPYTFMNFTCAYKLIAGGAGAKLVCRALS